MSEKIRSIDRNKLRRVYPKVRRKTEKDLYINADLASIFSLDRGKYVNDRDYFRIQEKNRSYVVGEFEEGFVHFDGTEENNVRNHFFENPFTGTPIIVLNPENTEDNQQNVDVVGILKTQQGFTSAISAPFSGSIRYRAIYAREYPVIVSSSFSGSYVAEAGTLSVNGLAYTASYDFDHFRGFKKTFWNANDNDMSVKIFKGEETDISSNGSFSSFVANSLDYIVHGSFDGINPEILLQNFVSATNDSLIFSFVASKKSTLYWALTNLPIPIPTKQSIRDGTLSGFVTKGTFTIEGSVEQQLLIDSLLSNQNYNIFAFLSDILGSESDDVIQISASTLP